MSRSDANMTEAQITELWAQWDLGKTVEETQEMQASGHLTSMVSTRQLWRHRKTYGNHRKGNPISELRKEFRWPHDIGDEGYQIPREYAQYAMRCTDYYLNDLGVWPLRGLVRYFAQVSAAQPEWENKQIAMFAEKFWYAYRGALGEVFTILCTLPT
jgi:hypothetical protein